MSRVSDSAVLGTNILTVLGIKPESVVQEASTAFDLNSGLFDLLDIEDEPLVEEAQKVEKTYPIAQVIAVIAAGMSCLFKKKILLNVFFAVCLSHFILVLGGFTGDKGYEKLIAAEQFIGDLWKQVSSKQ